MVFGGRLRSVVPVDEPCETTAPREKSMSFSKRLSALLSRKSVPAPVVRSHEDVTDLLGVMLRLGLAVCSVSPEECMSGLHSLPSSDFHWLRSAGNHLLDGLLIGELGFVVESAVSGFLAQGVDEMEEGSFRSGSESNEVTSNPRSNADGPPSFGGSGFAQASSGSKELTTVTLDVPAQPQRRRPSVADALAAVTAPVFQRRADQSDSVSSIAFLKNMLRRQSDTAQAVTTGDLKWTPDGCPVGDGDDAARSAASQGQALFKRYSREEITPPAAAAPQGPTLQVPTVAPSGRRPSNASLLSFGGGMLGEVGNMEPILASDSLLVHMLEVPNSVLMRHAPQQPQLQPQPQQQPTLSKQSSFEEYHSQRLNSGLWRNRKEDRLQSEGASSVATCVLLDMARGVKTGGGGDDRGDCLSGSSLASPGRTGGGGDDKGDCLSGSSLASPGRTTSDEVLGVPHGSRPSSFENVDIGGGRRPVRTSTDSSMDIDALTAIVEGQTPDVLDEIVDEAERELDPKRKYEERKKRMRNRKAKAKETGKVTYGALLRSQSAQDQDYEPDPGVMSVTKMISGGTAEEAVAVDDAPPEEAHAAPTAQAAPAADSAPASQAAPAAQATPAAEAQEQEDDAVARWKKRKQERRARKGTMNSTYGDLVRTEHAKDDGEVGSRYASCSADRQGGQDARLRMPGIAAEIYASAPPVPSGEADDPDDPNARWRRRREQIRERRRTAQKNTYGAVIRSEHEQNVQPLRVDTFDLDKPLPGVPNAPVGEEFGAKVFASNCVDPALNTPSAPVHSDFRHNFCSKEESSCRRSWTNESLLQPQCLSPTLSSPTNKQQPLSPSSSAGLLQPPSLSQALLQQPLSPSSAGGALSPNSAAGALSPGSPAAGPSSVAAAGLLTPSSAG